MESSLFQRDTVNQKRKNIKVKVLSNRKIAGDIYVMEIMSSWLAGKALPGQFVNIKVRQEGTDPLLRIPLGIHRISRKTISFLYKVVGRGTKILKERQEGETIEVLGPLGNGFSLQRTSKANDTAVLIAGGYGVSPIYALAEDLKKKKVNTVVFLGARTRKGIVCVKELRKLKAKVIVATDDGSMGKRGLITDVLAGYLDSKTVDKEKTSIYACGPEGMIKSACRTAQKKGITAQVTMDEYMACGIGACKGCAIDTKEGIKLSCTDGPVFDAGILKWE